MKKSLAICFVILAMSVGSADARPFRCFRSCRPHRCEKLRSYLEPKQCECCPACEAVEAMSSDTDFNDLQIEVSNLRREFSDYRNNTDRQIAELRKEIARFNPAE
jgi:hypothetical protein